MGDISALAASKNRDQQPSRSTPPHPSPHSRLCVLRLPAHWRGCCGLQSFVDHGVSLEQARHLVVVGASTLFTPCCSCRHLFARSSEAIACPFLMSSSQPIALSGDVCEAACFHVWILGSHMSERSTVPLLCSQLP